MKKLNSFKDFKENLKKTGFRYAFLLLLSLIIPQWTTAQLFPVAGNCTAGLGTTVYAPASSTSALSTSRHAVIYPASQLTGIVGQTLTSIYLTKITATDLGGTPNLKIYLATTTSTDFGSTSPDWATLITGATKVYDNNPATATAGAVGPKQLVFSANFVYPTSTNLMVMFEYVNTGNTTNVTWEYEYTSPCVSTANNNTTKYVNTVDGTLAAVLNSSNYRRPRIGFDYLVSCPAPTALTVNNITTNSATASWTIGGTETSWDFAVVAGGSGIPTTPSVVSANTQNVSSLTPNTSYDLYVRAKCGGSNGNSAWKGPLNFKTACAPTTSMYEGFEGYATGNFVPSCWVRLAPATSPGSQTITTTTPASGVNNIFQYAAAGTNPVIVVLPEFSNVAAGTNWLRFKARATASGGILSVGYVTDVTNYDSFVSIQDLTINNTVYTVPEAEYKVIIPNTIPANARLAIKNKNDGKSYYWDDVYWEVIPTCMPVTNITASNITTTSATISWTASSTVPALGYDVYYSTSATAPVATTTPNMNVATTTANISSLSSSSTYFVWVRAKCSATDSSSWAAMPSFNTLCDFVNVPYTQNFEGAVVPALPNCTTNQNVGAGNNWTTTSNPGYGFTTKVLYYQYNISNAANTWFYTPGINLQASVTYKIAFDYGNNSTSASFIPEKLKVAFGTSAVDTAMTTQIVDLPNINQGALQSYNGTFTVPTTGVYYFGWNAYSDANKYYIYVDNISITNNAAGTAEIATKDAIKVYPNPFHEVLNISDIKNVKSVNIIDASGRVVKTINQPSSQLQLGDLASGLYIVNLLHKDGTTTSIKAVKK